MLNNLHEYIIGTPPVNFVDKPGTEPYKLYNDYSHKHRKIADLGTLQGLSALALSSNPQAQVLSYDIDLSKNLVKKDNIKFIAGNCFDHLDDILSCDLILIDIDPHDGEQEFRMLVDLVANNYKGTTLWDDIHLNSEMQQFWDSVEMTKQDLTTEGHHSGTGLIVFS